MNKKHYIEPTMEILLVEACSLVCGSGESGAIIPGGSGSGTPSPDTDGIIHGESNAFTGAEDWDEE